MFKWFKRNPKYKEGHHSTWCAIKFVNGKVEPKLRMKADEYGYFSVPSDLNAVLKWTIMKLNKNREEDK